MKARQPLSLLIALIMVLGFGPSLLAQSDEDVTPDVRVSATGVVNGKVIIGRAAVDGPSWVVIHADDDGTPGEVIGYAPLDEGENTNIPIEIDTEAATPVLHAMLHEDAGEVGTYEFPGPDVPITIDDDIVMAQFSAAPVPAETAATTPDVQVSPEGVVDGQVTIARATTTGPSWVVIHADDDGAPGEVIGYAPLNAGLNTDVIVDIDTEAATPTLHAMLHDDQGEVGIYEFPGPDSPTQLDGNLVMAEFSVEPVLAEASPETDMSSGTSTGTGGPVAESQAATMMDSDAKGAPAPTTMPATGGDAPTDMILIVVMGILALLGSSTFALHRSRSARPQPVSSRTTDR